MSEPPQDRDLRFVDIDSLVCEAPLSTLPSAAVEDLLGLADDELIIGHRHSEWLGLSPFLEEDLTMSSIAQDEFGHARALYALIWPDWDEREAEITRRPASQWRSCALAELEGQPWERAFVRHLLYDVAEPFRWRGLVARWGDVVAGLDDLSVKACSEEGFHERHAVELAVRLGADGDGRVRLQRQLDELWPLVSQLRTGMDEDGWFNFLRRCVDVLQRAQLVAVPDDHHDDSDSLHRRKRSGGFGPIQRSLLDVVAFDPDARW